MAKNPEAQGQGEAELKTTEQAPRQGHEPWGRSSPYDTSAEQALLQAPGLCLQCLQPAPAPAGLSRRPGL